MQSPIDIRGFKSANISVEWVDLFLLLYITNIQCFFIFVVYSSTVGLTATPLSVYKCQFLEPSPPESVFLHYTKLIMQVFLGDHIYV